MTTNAIEVDGVSKRYLLGRRGGNDLREALVHAGKRLVGRGEDAVDVREHWALRDVSFTVADGERVGVIGRNGAGKSTLLKVLARITEPTTGRSRTRGRVGSLLEVGTGFHTELTGRENVFLNGAILGLSRRRVAEQLDQIVEFAGIDRFLDTPVKRYSSGMYLRLAFSVAAHLDTEILVVDEVLAVGDAEFQQKCLKRMSEAETQGRTIVFVSHDLNALASLCRRAIWLDKGRVRADGPSTEVIDEYLSTAALTSQSSGVWTAPGSGVALHDFTVVTSEGQHVHHQSSPLQFAFDFEIEQEIEGLRVAVAVYDIRGRSIVDEFLPLMPATAPGRYSGVMEMPPLLNIGRYEASLWIGTHYDDYAVTEPRVAFDVLGDHEGWGAGVPLTRPGVRWRAHGPSVPSAIRPDGPADHTAR